MRALPSAIVMLAALVPLAVALASTLAPLPNGPVAAVFPPWWSATEAAASAAAAGRVIRFGAVPFIVVVLATDRAELRAHGAWVLLDPRALGGCARSAANS